MAFLAILIAGASASTRLDAFTSNMGFWRDMDPPDVLDGFTAVTGAATGQVAITVDFPVAASLNDYSTVVIRRLAGATAPNANCSSDGTPIKTYTTPTFPDPDSVTDTGTGGSFYSYRACIYDASGNLESSQTQTNVMAKAGAYYSGITYYADGGLNYAGCLQPTEAAMNDESVAQAKRTYGSYNGSDDWIRADLGSVKSITRVRVGGNGPYLGSPSCWVTSTASYWTSGVKIQFSNNATFTDMVASDIDASAAITYSDTVMKNIDFTARSARYVRIWRNNWIGTGQFRIGDF